MRIMDHLQNYCPKLDDKVFQIPVHGDALSVERMVKAQQLRVASSTAEDRLEGLEPIPQEFHKRGIILQVQSQITELLLTMAYTELKN